MKKRVLILSILAVMLIATSVFALRDDVYVKKLFFWDEYVDDGDYLVLSYTLDDHVTGLVKGLKVVVVVPELGIRVFDNYHKLRSDKSGLIYIWIPYGTPSGEYVARIGVYSDDHNEIRNIKHRFFNVR